MTGTNPTLYEQLGGADAVAGVVRHFHDRLVDDPTVGHLFPADRQAALLERQVAYVSGLLGGPDRYEGEGLVAAHAGVPGDPAIVELMVGHLRAALAEGAVAPDLGDKVVAVVTRVWLARTW
jgi:hemoglobin